MHKNVAWGIMKKEVAAAWATAGACSIIWLAVAFLVAFPQEVTAMDARAVARKFMDADHAMERLFIPILVGVDIVIDRVLGHMRLRGWFAIAAVGSILFYLVFVIIGPFYNGAPEPQNEMRIFMFALLLLAVPRFGAYFQMPTFHAVGASASD
jgi:hypothetical protein